GIHQLSKIALRQAIPDPKTGVSGSVLWLLAGVKQKEWKTEGNIVIPNYNISWPQRAKPSGFG
ncbi:hypothetical protein, partial [Faecalicatena contorta]|uniref:hypothetical protein n=1 Tax=Faecalicatena contorta TaxID=39482 RepID=UPI001A9A2E64